MIPSPHPKEGFLHDQKQHPELSVPKTFSLKNLVALSETVKEQIVMPADALHHLRAAILSSGFCHNTTTVSPPMRRAKGVRPF
jgi:hypothetical protein